MQSVRLILLSAAFTLVLDDTSFVSVSVKEKVGTADEKEFFEITKAEVYIFRAGLESLRALVKIAMAYDIQPVGSDGSYGWMKNLNKDNSDSQRNSWDSYTLTTVNGKNIITLTEDTESDSRDDDVLIFKTLKLNYDKSAFGKLYSGNQLAGAQTDLLAAVADLKSAVTVVDAVDEGLVDVSHRLITKSKIADLDSTIDKMFSSVADYFPGEDLTTCSKVLTFINKALQYPVTVAIPTKNSSTLTDVSIDISSFFEGKIADIRNVLPYFKWRAESAWVEDDSRRESNYFGGFNNSSVSWDTQLAWYNNNITTGVWTDNYPDMDDWGNSYNSDKYWGDERWLDTAHWTDSPQINNDHKLVIH